MKDNTTIDIMIAAEMTKLAKLEEKQNEIGRKAKTCRANIEKYKLMKNNNQFNTLSNALNGKGLSIEDIVTALSNGDLLSLQDKLESIDNVEKVQIAPSNNKDEETEE